VPRRVRRLGVTYAILLTYRIRSLTLNGMLHAKALGCLGDPTRRQVFERLRAGPLSVGEIARDMPVSRPAVSQHLALLREAGLVIDRPVGTKRVYYIDPRGLSAVRAWLDQFWDQALASFQAEAERRIQTEKEKKE
jgi:DNA-binding transcriptional ArsR family regulator